MAAKKQGFFDVMTPVSLDNNTVWVKVGIYTPNTKNERYFGIVSLTALPIGAQAPLRLFIYPSKQKIKSKEPIHSFPGHQVDEDDLEADRNPESHWDLPKDFESPGGG